MASLGPAGSARRVCANHPDRPGHALCMACRKTVCGECATEWDGINYCVSCLAARRQAARGRSSLPGWAGTLLSCALLFYCSLRLMLWLGVLLASGL